MKTIIKLLAIFALALAAFGQHLTASAGGGLGKNFKGPSAIASFFDASGCINTDVFVIASEAKTQDSTGKPTNLSFASVTIFQYDSCTDTVLLSAWGTTNPLPKSALQISKTLDTGALNTTVNLFDEVSVSNFDVQVDLAWTATGPLNREKFTTHVKTPGCITNSHYQGKSRPAQAVGTVSNGLINFTPSASIQGTSLSSVKSGTVVIGCS
jgi:hypothetical protein